MCEFIEVLEKSPKAVNSPYVAPKVVDLFIRMPLVFSNVPLEFQPRIRDRTTSNNL
jgi:hypothetical protein